MATEKGISTILQDLVGNRPFVFAVMTYDAKWPTYRGLKEAVQRELGLACIRADEVLAAGYDLLDKVHLLIDRAEVVLAEITPRRADCYSPNVFYEIGYAVAQKKELLLLIERGCEVPADLRGREVIAYEESARGTAELERQVCNHIRSRVNSRVALLQDMLEGPVPDPAYIVASPKYPGPESRIWGQLWDERTYGDNLGIRGLFSAFAAARGESIAVELISAQNASPALERNPWNLYLIGSRKSNPATGRLLPAMLEGLEPYWELGPAEGQEAVEDYQVALYQTVGGVRTCIPGEQEDIPPDRLQKMRQEARDAGLMGEVQPVIHTLDHGIIVRGPHPDHREHRVVLVMAGPHSLGTGAACLAATRSQEIQEIAERLGPKVLADKSRTFWVLVEGRASKHDYHLDIEGVRIVGAGVYP